jgi:hypothetical protein
MTREEVIAGLRFAYSKEDPRREAIDELIKIGTEP